jgi:hypothetical protein
MTDKTPTLPNEIIVGASQEGVGLAMFDAGEYEQATRWIEIDPDKRKLWRVKLEPVAELLYVPPTEATLEHRTL